MSAPTPEQIEKWKAGRAILKVPIVSCYFLTITYSGQPDDSRCIDRQAERRCPGPGQEGVCLFSICRIPTFPGSQ